MDTIALLSIIVPIVLSLFMVGIVWAATTDITKKKKR